MSTRGVGPWEEPASLPGSYCSLEAILEAQTYGPQKEKETFS